VPDEDRSKEREMQNYIGDEEMIRSEHRWPGETLCVKQRPTNGEKADFMGCTGYGVITTNTEPVTVYLRSVPGVADFAHTKEYSTVSDMLADGWIVD
jgi:hypothetical protein